MDGWKLKPTRQDAPERAAVSTPREVRAETTMAEKAPLEGVGKGHECAARLVPRGQYGQTALQGKAERGSWLLWTTTSTGFEVTEDNVQGVRGCYGPLASSSRGGSRPEPDWASGD